VQWNCSCICGIAGNGCNELGNLGEDKFENLKMWEYENVLMCKYANVRIKFKVEMRKNGTEK
jgi:hypothetical protein